MDQTNNLPEVSHLPISAQRLVAVIGLPATLLLVDKQGGSTFRLFSTGPSMGAIINTVGAEIAWKLQRHFGSDTFDVPKCQEELLAARDADIHAKFDKLTRVDGRSARDSIRLINNDYHMTDRHIWRILKKPSSIPRVKSPVDTRQLSLL